MYRSYFFALFACAIFSCAALLNAYQNLPPVREIQVPEKIGSISSDPLPSSTAVPNTASKQECLGKDTQEHSPSTPLPTASPIGSSSPVTATAQSSSTPPRLFPGKPKRRETLTTPLNERTDNFNILLLGVDGSNLEMVCIYSINHHLTTELKSVSLFFPVNSVLLYKGKEKTLDKIFAEGHWKGVAEAVEKAMYIDIHKYVKIDRQALRELEKYFDPIFVDGKKVEMETLFVRRTSSKDDRIIALILKQVLRPEVFFRYIPGLVFGINKDIESNFSFTPKDLAFYYRIGKKLSTKRIKKIVLTGETEWQEGRRVNIPPKEVMGNAIYRATKP